MQKNLEDMKAKLICPEIGTNVPVEDNPVVVAEDIDVDPVEQAVDQSLDDGKDAGFELVRGHSAKNPGKLIIGNKQQFIAT